MPIVYETEAPVAAAAGVYDRLANYRGSYGGGGGGGGGGGRGYGGGGIPYDTGIQDAINNRDQMQFQQQATAQRADNQILTERMQQQGAMAQDRQRFELQAQLHEVELSQQERMRLQRLKNAIGEVSSDATLTDQEKSDYVQQLKYNIDPLQRRLSQEKLQQEKLVKDSIADQKTAAAAFEKQRLDVLGKSTQDRMSFVPDATSLAEATDDITANVGEKLTAQFGPERAKAMIAQMAQEEVLKQGLGSHFIMQPDGKLMPLDGHSGMKSDGDGSGKAASHSSDDHAKLYDRASAQVDKERSRRKPKEDGSDSQEWLHPQDAESRNKMIAGEIANIQKHMEGAPRPAGKKAYTSKYAAAQAATAAPSTQVAAAAAQPGQKPPTKERTEEDIAEDHRKLILNTDLPDADKERATNILWEARTIAKHFPLGKEVPKEIKERKAKLVRDYEELTRRGQKPISAPQIGSTGLPPETADTLRAQANAEPKRAWWQMGFNPRPPQ